MAQAVVGHWSSFVQTGTPSGPVAWPAYDASSEIQRTAVTIARTTATGSSRVEARKKRAPRALSTSR